jgi:hypothetical protein
MIQVGERAERPFIPVILRMKCPLRSNPPYGSQTRKGEDNKSCDTPQRDESQSPNLLFHMMPSSRHPEEI